MGRTRGLGIACVCSVLGAQARAQSTSPFELLPGSSREITRTDSASRDAPVSEVVFTPRVGIKGAADVGFVRLARGGFALRPGLFGLAELEYTSAGGFWPVAPSTGPLLFRGQFGFTLALSAEALARRWLGPRGALELTGGIGHESDHVLSGGTGGGGGATTYVDAPNQGDILDGGGGNFVVMDLAARTSLSTRLDIAGWARVADRAYWNGAVVNAPAIEAGMRWHLSPRWQPVAAAFGELLLTDRASQNAPKPGGRFESMLGLAVRGTLGEVVPYVSLDVGNGYGLLINHRELVVSFGGRYAPF